MADRPAVAVVGAGWAGLAAALSLVEAGVGVTLFDSAPVAGGRARTTSLETPLGRFELDNGQHLIVGAYRETLALIDRLGASQHLRHDRLELSSLPGQACAQSFATVIRDTLGSDLSASDFVTGSAPLGALLPEPALARLAQSGAQLRLRETVRALDHLESGWVLGTTRPQDGNGQPGSDGAALEPAGPYAAVLLALPPWSANRLLASTGLDVAALGAFEPEPIATAWAFWPADSAPALPRWSLLDDDPARGWHGQWLFDRGIVAPAGNRDGARVAGVVISVASRLDGCSTQAVADGVSAQLAAAFGEPVPAAVRIVTERRATFRCTPDRPRLASDHYATQQPGLWLAGDWLWPDYPATLESAVRSGRQAGAAIAASLKA
jgi:predicted NAD/FAD-dependent oxidoreductase